MKNCVNYASSSLLVNFSAIARGEKKKLVRQFGFRDAKMQYISSCKFAAIHHKRIFFSFCVRWIGCCDAPFASGITQHIIFDLIASILNWITRNCQVRKKSIFKSALFSLTHHHCNYKNFIWASCTWRTFLRRACLRQGSR